MCFEKLVPGAGTSFRTRLDPFFLDGLQLNAITPPPVIRTETRLPQTVELDDYRERMLSHRLLSVDRPGVYLDRSTTGAGKSAIDFQVITNILGSSEGLV